MVDTLHNDVEEHVRAFREDFPDAFEDETLVETLSRLPQISTRFPGLRYKSDASNFLMPLSRAAPLLASRVHNLEAVSNQKTVPRELAEAALSMATGRTITYDDPFVKDHLAETRGIDASVELKGNLFARSTWLSFTKRAMEARGFSSEVELDRADDHGINLAMKVRNARAISKHAERNEALSDAHELGCLTFEGQERKARERARKQGATGATGAGASASGAERARKRAFEDNLLAQRMAAQKKRVKRV